MNIDMSQLAPYIWILAAILVVIVAFVIIRFFWQHVLKFLLKGCLGILGFIALLAVLHFVFKLF
jgi:hypothetical protein